MSCVAGNGNISTASADCRRRPSDRPRSRNDDRGDGRHVAGLASDREGAFRLAPLANIAFVDVNLSDGATGPKIVRQLAEDHGISVVSMTANPKVVADGVHGALGVVRKPVMPRAVEQLLKYVAARRAGTFAVVPPHMMVFA